MKKILLKILNHLSSFNDYQVTNEGFRTWLATFMLLANMGLVPAHIQQANAETKKDFIETLSDDKVDAAKFVDFMTGKSFLPFDEAWAEFEKEVGASSSKDEVEKHLTKSKNKYDLNTTAKLGSTDQVSIPSGGIMNFRPNNWVTDMAKIFDDRKEEPAMNKWIADFEKKTAIEVMVLTIPSLEGQVIEDYAQNTFERIGIGKVGADNGVLIVVAKEDRKMRVHTGYGIEEFVTDYQASRMISKMQGNFREGDFHGGVMEALEHINSIMDGMSVEQREIWLKDKEEADRKAAQEAWDSFVGFLTNALLVILLISIIVGPIVYARHRIKKRREYLAENKRLKEKIRETLDKIERVKGKLPQSTTLKSDKLNKIINRLSQISGREVKGLEDGDNVTLKTNLTEINQYKSLLGSVLSEYRYQKSELESQVKSIKGYSSIVSSAIAATDRYIADYNKVVEYGYSASKPASKNFIKSLEESGEAAAELINTDLDKAYRDFTSFRRQVDQALSGGRSASSKLRDIETAKKQNANSKSELDYAKDAMMRFKKWARRGEQDKVEMAIAGFFDFEKKESPREILKINSKLNDVLGVIASMKRTWKRRKEDEERREREERRRKEREERRRREARRAASYSSSSSWSSSSSGSSFGGFGGGSSGGGGASGGW